MELPPEILYETITNLEQPSIKEVEDTCLLNKGVSVLCKKLRIYKVLLEKNFPNDYKRLKGLHPESDMYAYPRNSSSMSSESNEADKLKYNVTWQKYHNLNNLFKDSRSEDTFYESQKPTEEIDLWATLLEGGTTRIGDKEINPERTIIAKEGPIIVPIVSRDYDATSDSDLSSDDEPYLDDNMVKKKPYVTYYLVGERGKPVTVDELIEAYRKYYKQGMDTWLQGLKIEHDPELGPIYYSTWGF